MPAFPDDDYDVQTFRGLKHEGTQIEGVAFLDCTFINCSFRETIFKACKFQGCVFKKCDLSLAQVERCTFTNTLFKDSRLLGVNWTKASWGKSELHVLLKTIDFTNCVLNYSSFTGLNLEKMVMRRCTALEVDFSEANLRAADCMFTDFTKSQFRHTDLTGTDLRGATNYFIQPGLNTLKKTRFSLPEAMSLLYNLDIEIGDPFDEPDEDNPGTN
jgi:fluoroquinolone resistance protein